MVFNDIGGIFKLKQITLKEMQKIELNILIEFSEICKRHNLRYYLAGGTLLGAVRHKGFIPWDDDIDIKMPRKDYEKFIKLSKLELPSHLYVLSPYDKTNCKYTFIKICDKRTKLIEYSENNRKELNVYIDILPMDGYPSESNKLNRHIKKLYRWNSLFHYSMIDCELINSGYNSKIVSLFNNIKKFHKTLPYSIYKKLTKIATRYDYDNSEYVGLAVEGNLYKEKFNKQWLEEPVYLEFEGYKFLAPNGYKEHLKIFYGDYMKLPPKEKRVTHHNNEAYWIGEE